MRKGWRRWAARVPRWGQILLALGVVLLAASAYLYLNHKALRHTLAHWTGEEALREQLKGTLALAALRLTRLPPRTDPYLPIAHTGVCPYGINTFLEQEVEAAKVERSLQLVRAAGFCWIRQEFPWQDIEISAKGDFWDHKWNVSAWDKYDRLVGLAERYGVQIIARLDAPPAWSRQKGGAPGWTLAPPDQFEDYGDFVAAVVSRYRGRIRTYQIWNEPNIYPEWGDQPADPAAYTRLLQIAYRRAKEADPQCVILAAGLAQTTEETPWEFGPRNVSDLLYLEEMYKAGAKDHFDIMGAMVYGLWTGPYDRRISRDRANFSRAQLLREIMVRWGDAAKPIWATEVGWNALPEDFAAPASYGRVSEEQQAIYALEAYQRAQREWPWMGVMNYWFLRRPSDAEKNQAWYYFRALEPDFTPLPAYSALSWLATRDPAVPIGYHQEDHWATHYEGPWEHRREEAAVLGAAAWGREGATLSFYFEGTALALVLRDERQISNLEVRVDGRVVDANALWRAPQAGPRVVTVASFLADRRHRAELRVRAGEVGLDGLLVWRQEWGWAWLAGGGLLGLALLLWAGLRRRRARRGHV
jgi:uncharacterized protein (DUF427 family)